MTSLACVPVGRAMLSCVALLVVPLLALAEPSKPMITAPGQVSATSHSFAAARHTVPALPAACWQLELVPSHVSVVQGLPSSAHAAPALPAGCWQALLVPLHWSRVQGLPSSVQAVPAGSFALVGQVVLVPVQVSTASHSSAAARHAAPALPAGCWQALLVPLHWSRVQGLPSSVQAVPAGSFALVGQVVLVPVQVSTASHSSAAARHTAPTLPGGCWQALLVPLHWSRVQGLPSSVQAVPAGSFALVGQVVLVPVQVSTASHSSAAARHTAPTLPGGCWQVVLLPSHLSSVQGLPSSGHAAPALPAGCWQPLLVPSHWSSV